MWFFRALFHWSSMETSPTMSSDFCTEIVLCRQLRSVITKYQMISWHFIRRMHTLLHLIRTTDVLLVPNFRLPLRGKLKLTFEILLLYD